MAAFVILSSIIMPFCACFRFFHAVAHKPWEAIATALQIKLALASGSGSQAVAHRSGVIWLSGVSFFTGRVSSPRVVSVFRSSSAPASSVSWPFLSLCYSLLNRSQFIFTSSLSKYSELFQAFRVRDWIANYLLTIVVYSMHMFVSSPVFLSVSSLFLFIRIKFDDSFHFQTYIESMFAL